MSNPVPAFLNPASIAARYDLSRAYIDQLVADGKWPAPRRFGPRCVRHEVALCDAFVKGEVDVRGQPIKETV